MEKDAMVRKNIWGFGIVWLAIVGMLLPVPVVSAAGRPPVPAAVAGDVMLSVDGVLRGQVLSPQGRGMVGVRVAFSDGARELGSTVTGVDGRFEVRGLKGGVVTLAAGTAKSTYRVWTAKAAPPAAQKGVLLVPGQSQTLGQSWDGFKKVCTNPWVIAGIVAAAVAIPVAIHNSNDDGPASP
jgi:hypothetical protein